MEIELSPKQQHLLNLMLTEDVNEILYGGSASGGKSFGACMVGIILAVKFPGLKIGIFRKTTTDLRSSTFDSMMRALTLCGLQDEVHYAVKNQLFEIWLSNGSKFLFRGLDPQGDAEFTKIGSLEIDFAFVDEAGEILQLAKDVLRARIGRAEATKKYALQPKIVLLANPSQNFIFNEYYKPYEKLGGGEYQQWQIGEITSKAGTKIPSYRAFLRASVYDNPFVPKSVEEQLQQLPTRERKRLLLGDWYFNEDDNSLFTEDSFRKSLTQDYPQPKTRKVDTWKERGIIRINNGKEDRYTEEEIFSKYIGVDVADSGKDETVAALIYNETLVDIQSLKIDKNSSIPIAQLYAKALQNFATKNGFTKREARNIWIESNGVGTALCAMMKRDGWIITEYTATGQSRSEGYYSLYLDMDGGNIKIYEPMSGYETLRRQMAAHQVNLDGEKPKVLPKEKVRQIVGHSPDYSDAFYIANKARHTNITYNKANRFRLATVG